MMHGDSTSARVMLGSLVRDLRTRLREEREWGETDVPYPAPGAVRAPLPSIPALEAARPRPPERPLPPEPRRAPPPMRPEPPQPPPSVAPPRSGAQSAYGGPAPALMNDIPAGAEGLGVVRERLGDCRRCGLCEGRSTIVFGEGSADARLMFVGEGPGYHEDQQGRPFVGPAGQLLDRMIGAMGFARSAVYIANVVKCRPPNNRDPAIDERLACRPFVHGQIQAVRPEVIVTLGKVATQTLLETEALISRLRGTFTEYPHLSVPVMPTYHPAAVLRNERLKRPVWEDLKKVMEHLGVQRQPR